MISNACLIVKGKCDFMKHWAFQRKISHSHATLRNPLQRQPVCTRRPTQLLPEIDQLQKFLQINPSLWNPFTGLDILFVRILHLRWSNSGPKHNRIDNNGTPNHNCGEHDRRTVPWMHYIRSFESSFCANICSETGSQAGNALRCSCPKWGKLQFRKRQRAKRRKRHKFFWPCDLTASSSFHSELMIERDWVH